MIGTKLSRWIGVGLLTALALVAAAGAAAWRHERERRWSERIILGTVALPPRDGGGSPPRQAEELSRWTRMKGALRLLREGYTAAAVASWREGLSPSAARPPRRRLDADQRDLLSIARSVSPLLPANHTVLQICRFPVKGAPEQWAVLSARLDEPEVEGLFYDPRLSLLRRDGGMYRFSWQSAAINDPRFGPVSWNEVYLYATDLTGDGVPEAAVQGIFWGADWTPSCIILFAWQQDRLHKVFGVASCDPLWIKDLNDDQRYEIGACRTIGPSASLSEQPHWNDIYSCTNSGVFLTNSRFPEEFSELESQILGLLRRYPADEDLQRHLKIIRKYRPSHGTRAVAGR